MPCGSCLVTTRSTEKSSTVALMALAVLLLAAACSKDSLRHRRLRMRWAPVNLRRVKSAETTPAEPPVVETPDTGAAAAMLAKWTGDFDGMIERRMIRVLTTYSKTTFFIDRGQQLGLVPDAFRLFEDDLNKRLNNKNIRVHVMFVPVAHDDLIPALLEGRGDIVAAGKLITAWRKEEVDFANPTRSGISSIIVSGPAVPPIATVQDLGGKEVYLRTSDVSTRGVEQFNAQLAASGKPPVKIRPAPEVLADEDILEMVNAGLVPMTMVDDYVAEFWRQIFPGIVLNTPPPSGPTARRR